MAKATDRRIKGTTKFKLTHYRQLDSVRKKLTQPEAMPDNWRLLYNLACAYALKGDKRGAIETLNKAVQKGFANAEELERNDQLDSIREEAGFKKIVEGLKQKR